MGGVLCVYKPKGVTSHDVVDIVRKKLNVKKVGHAGTLDPMAEGVLIILIGSETRRQKEFMALEKEYIAEIMFGIESGTYDLESLNVRVKKAGVKIKKSEVEKILEGFKGRITQKVPPYSAVKIKGKPLYWYARANKLSGVEIPTKKVYIKEVKLLDFDEKRKVNIAGKILELPVVKIKVVCSSGTYIRSLAHDMGNKLGCGAVLSSLTRTRVGRFGLKDAKPIDYVIRLNA